MLNIQVDMLKQALLNIKSQKLISTIILSSIIAGIASIYILFVIKHILAYELKTQLTELGENNFVATFIPEAGMISLHPILQYEKIIEYGKNNTNGSMIPYSIIGSELVYESKKYPGMLLAVGNNLSLLNIHMIHGRALKLDESNDKVIVLGKALAVSISSDLNKLTGEYIQHQDQLLKIIGLYEQTGSNLLDEQLDYSALISYPLALRLTENIQLDHLYVVPNLNQAKNILVNHLTDFYQNNIASGSFHIKDADFILVKIKAQFAQVELILKWVCFISLGLGSLLLTQLFLLSLDKRKFEIGIRLACGAGPKDILIQFIQESFLYYIIGAGIGIILGMILLLAWLFIFYQTGWPFLALISALWPVTVAIFFMAIIIGLMPGLRSLNLHPMAFFKPGV